MLIPVVLLLGFAAWRWYENQTPGMLTPERKAIYTFAIREERDPNKIKYWANWFRKEGFGDLADNLDARLKIPAVNGEVRARRNQIVRRALYSNNPAAIFGIADEFECQGYGDVAYMLRDYANGLRWSLIVPECRDEIPGPPPDWRFGQDTK